MAVEAPAHLHGRALANLGHLVDAAVAGDAADALGDVDRVVEVDEVRQLVDLLPLDRLTREVGLPYQVEVRRLVPDLRMTVHADAGGRAARTIAGA